MTPKRTWRASASCSGRIWARWAWPWPRLAWKRRTSSRSTLSRSAMPRKRRGSLRRPFRDAPGGARDGRQLRTGDHRVVRFERSVFAAQAATSKQAQMLARMRFSTDQVKGAMQNLDPFLDLFVGKFAHLHEGPEKVGVAMEFMGRAGANNIKFM